MRSTGGSSEVDSREQLGRQQRAVQSKAGRSAADRSWIQYYVKSLRSEGKPAPHPIIAHEST